MAGRVPVWCPPAWDMVAFEWEGKMGRAEAAAALRRLGDGLDGGERVEIEDAGWELFLEVDDHVELEIEVEIDGPETEVEIELSWSTRDGGACEAGGGAGAVASDRARDGAETGAGADAGGDEDANADTLESEDSEPTSELDPTAESAQGAGP
jgi:amphi-Trp domain-containing protein